MTDKLPPSWAQSARDFREDRERREGSSGASKGHGPVAALHTTRTVKIATPAAPAATAAAAVLARTGPAPDIGIEKVPEFSDDWLALTFTQRNSDLRYCAAWNKWLRWDGKQWLVDETKQVFDLARKICREIAVEYRANDRKAAKQLVASKTIAAVVKLAESDRLHAATVVQWDANPCLLNTPDFTVNLQTGERRPHSADDYITRMTAVSPGGECPIWHAFLDRVTDGNQELKAFLQRVLGYALTGTTTEHALFFLYGKGANGKSVFINPIAGILAEYHKTAPIETFTASNSDRHPTELAMLRGARIVTATETEEGRRWAESRIKQLTGGDKVSARFMRQDFFEYMPQFKLIIAGNNKPGLRSVDEAMKRRLNLIPFLVTIPPDERDPKLTEKLRAEWPGILRWMIEGCLEWQHIGLAPPKVVTQATAAYLDAEDPVLAWLDECCEFHPTYWEPRSKLYASYKLWALNGGEDPRSGKWLYEKLETRPQIAPHKRSVQGFTGMRLKQDYGYELRSDHKEKT